jgi:hypothetical protein
VTIVPVIVAAVVVAQASPDRFVVDLQRAVARGDRQAVAEMVQYPITVTISGVRVSLRDPSGLVDAFDSVFTAELKNAIREGSAIREGLIGVTRVNGVPKITQIAAIGRMREGARSRPSAARPVPRRVTFVQGVGQLSGTLGPGESESFAVFTEKNALLTIRIDGVRGREVVLRVFDARTGKPPDARAATAARAWTGRVPVSADYRIEVINPADHGTGIPYVLFVRRQ